MVPEETDAQRLARAQGIAPHADMLTADPARMGLAAATRYVLKVRTNVILIVASAAGYYFLAGVQTFGVEFVRGHYHVGAALANLLMLAVGAGAVLGVVVTAPAAALIAAPRRPARSRPGLRAAAATAGAADRRGSGG